MTSLNTNVIDLPSTIQREAAGRIHELGSLYNARTDQFVHGNIITRREGKDLRNITTVNSFEFETSYSEKVTDRFDALKIKGEVSLSILGGLMKVEGAANYLNERTNFDTSVEFSILQKGRTWNEELNLYDQDLRQYICTDVINSEVTHIVTRIERGANACMSVKYNLLDSESKTEVKGNIQGVLEKFKVALKASVSREISDREFIKDQRLEIRIHADVAPPQFTPPQTLEEALQTMTDIHKKVTCTEGEQGVPLTYYLLDVKEFIRICQLTISYDSIYTELCHQDVVDLQEMVNKMTIQSQKVEDLKKSVQNKAVPFHLQQGILTFCERAEKEERTIREKLMKLLPKARNGDVTAQEELRKLPNEVEPSSLSNEKIEECRSNNKPALRGIELSELFVGENVSFLGELSELRNLRLHEKRPILILFYSLVNISDDRVWWKTLEIFVKQCKTGNNYPVAICTDGNDEILKSEEIDGPNKIAVWEKGVYETRDQYNDMEKLKAFNFAYPQETSRQNTSLFKSTVYAIFRCPNQACNLEKLNLVKWSCKEFCDVLQYDVKNKVLICSCGSLPAEKFMFKCSNKQHGNTCTTFDKCVKEDLEQLKEYPQKNILIIGETGVGKTTFINSTACYTMFPTLEEAENNDLPVLIPFSFSTRANGTKTIFKFGNCNNEREIRGESCTKYPKEHYFKTDDTIFCLIDTPGIGDSYGVKQDKKNMQNIMTFLNSTVNGKKFEKLHLICFVMEPDKSRLTENFKYCFKELIMQFHRSALNNIVFCFTKGCGIMYQMGETADQVDLLLEEITTKLNEKSRSSAKLDPLILKEDENAFVVDNFAFRYLAMLAQGYKDKNKNLYSEGFRISRGKIMKMMELAKTIRPHNIEESQYVNNARKTITALSGPLVKIGQAVRKTVAEMEEKEKERNQKKMTAEQLEKELYKPVRFYRYQMSKVNIVKCKFCVVIKEVTGPERLKYIEADPELANEDPIKMWNGPGAIKRDDGTYECPEHGTDFSQVVIGKSFSREDFTENRLDEEVEIKLRNTKNAKDRVEILLNEVEKLRDELEVEEAIIKEASAKFAIFLRDNTLTPYNDCTEAYLHLCMENEEREGKAGMQKWRDLKSMLQAHLEEKNCIQKEIDKENQQAINSINPSEILKLVDVLKGLKHYGEDVVDALKPDPNQWKPNINTAPPIHNSDNNPSRLRRLGKFIGKLFGYM